MSLLEATSTPLWGSVATPGRIGSKGTCPANCLLLGVWMDWVWTKLCLVVSGADVHYGYPFCEPVV
jgi:hypothetical protein